MNTKLTKLEKYWILYDVGNSAFTLLIATILPLMFLLGYLIFCKAAKMNRN